MFCYKCGNKLSDNSIYCDQCGASTKREKNDNNLKYFCLTSKNFWVTMEKALFSFEGRVSSKTALKILIHWIVTFVLMAMLYITLVSSVPSIKALVFDRFIMFWAFTFIPTCFLILCFTTLLAKRLHDSDLSYGVMFILLFIRFIVGCINHGTVNLIANIIFLVLVIAIFLAQGDFSKNKYGDSSL